MYVAVAVALSSILTVASAIPYMIEIVRGSTKPRVVSWLTWSTLTAIASAAALVDGQYPTAILLLFATLETLLIVMLGWKHGDKKIGRFDAICLMVAMIGVLLWQIFNSPAIAVIATVSIDLIGGLPTMIHAWKKPYEETWLTFLLAFLGAVCTLLVIDSWRITAAMYPIYLVIINLLFTVIVLARRCVQKP